MARKRKVYDPAEAHRQALERQEQDAILAHVKSQGAEFTLDKVGRLISARRSNVFNLLLKRGSITQNQYDAAYTLAGDWAQWKGLDGRGDTMGELVDGSGGCREIVTDRMIRGGRRVSEALSSVDPMSRVVLETFMVATVEQDRPMAWRGVMERIKVFGKDRQTATMVQAVEALRVYYEGSYIRDKAAPNH